MITSSLSRSPCRIFRSLQFTETRRPVYQYTKQTEQEKKVADSGRFKMFACPVIERIPVLQPLAPPWYEEWFLEHINFTEKYGRNWTYEEIVEKMQQMRDGPKGSKKQAKKQAKKGDSGKFVVNEGRLRKQLGMSPLDPGKQRQVDAMMEKRKVMYHNPRETAFDKADNRKQLYRALDKSLYLLVKKYRTEDAWQFPIAVWDGQETMRQTAERAVLDEFGPGFKTYFLGNSPEGHWVEYFTKEQKEISGFEGYKIFYYRALLLSGALNIDTDKTSDYAWSTKEQLVDYFPSQRCILFNNMLDF